jgi:hypothetical protein
MNRRGITLTEVLVAIFVTGLGLISLMTLFPIGALNMAQAIKDDRTAHCAANASSYLRIWWRTQVEYGQSTPAAWGQNFPVYVDPIGNPAVSPTINGTAIPRVAPPWATTQPTINRQFMLLDDITTNQNGLARIDGAFIERNGKYSWAYMVRLLNNDPRVLEYEIVVYHGRPLSASSSLSAVAEQSFAGVINAGSNTVTIAGAAKVKRGGWIMDGTNGYFYRVKSVTNSGGSVGVVVENPFRASGNTVVVMENVFEVFERSTAE